MAIASMQLERASIADYESVLAFYKDVTDRTPGIADYAQWQCGKHPSAEGLKAIITDRSLYLYRNSGKIVGAMAVAMHQDNNYRAVEWSVKAADDEVAVLSILAVTPDFQGSGIGAKMVQKAISIAQKNNKKAIRLDTTATNTPAQRLYKRLGFEYRGQQHLLAENTGWIDFFFFEHLL